MADSKLSALTALTPLADGDLFYVVRSTTSYKTTLESLRAAVGGIEGEATNYAALPVTVGTPAVGARYIVENDQGSYFTFNKYSAGLYQRTANNGVSADWTRLGDFTLVPFRDDQAFYDNVDGTKTLKFQLSGITTATERVATWPDKDGTVAMTNDKLSAAAATTSAELAGVISDETGTGSLVFANTPTLVTPVLGTPGSGTLTNCTGLPVATGISGLGAGVATALAVNVGSAGAPVVLNGAGGTPSALDLTNATAYPVASTSRTGATPQATAPAAGLLSVLAIANGETVRTDKAIFDTTNPAALGSVGPGTATVAARRDHVHAMPSAADVSALPTAGGTMSGSITLGENTGVALDPAGSADGKWSGITVTGLSGYSQAFGDLVTLDKDDSRWEAVDISVAAAATGDARGIMGMVVSAGTDGNACTVLLHGIIRADANFPTLTIGAPVYASTTGDVVVAQPTTTDYVIRVIGHGLTADELYFHPDNAYITHT